jgi:hypothetical protein
LRDTLNIFEHQRYISKLIQWGFEASERERSRPHLVERDNETFTQRGQAAQAHVRASNKAQGY